MNKAYSLLDVKSVSQDGNVITVRGFASTPSTDRMGDIVEPMGARFKTPMPLFLHHNSERPVGRVMSAKASKAGIEFVAEIPKVKEPGIVQDRANEAIHSLQYGLIGATSIGFTGQPERHKSGGNHFKEWDWLELSLVTIPANPDAVITGVKSIDSALRAASGLSKNLPGASGKSNHRSLKGKEIQMQTLSQLREERNTKHARMQELVELMKAEDHETVEEETSEYDDLETEIKSLDTEIRVARFTALNASTAKAVDGTSSARASASRGGEIIVRKEAPDDAFKGQSWTRMVIAKAMGMNQGISPAEYAQHRWGKSNPTLVRWIKATVAGGGTDSGEWGAELVGIDNRYTGDFVEFLYGMTVFDKLALRPAPANAAIKGQDGAATGYWVGQSKAIPMSKPDFSTTSTVPFKVASLTVGSNELMADSSPGAEQWIRDALVEALAQRIDTTFLSTAAAVAGVSPAGILNGVTALSSAGVDEAGVRSDIKALYAAFITAKTVRGLVLVMHPAQAKALSLMVNALGQSSFDKLTSEGGNLLGDGVVVGDNVDPSHIILLSPRDIWKIGDSGLQVSVSREATIEQRDDPTGATDTPVGVTTAGLTNMFQEDSTAIKVVRRINFAKRRPTAVAYIDDANYDGTTS